MGVNTSNNVTFRLCDLKFNLMFLLRRMTNKTLCHAELGSASHKHSNKVFNTSSYRANEVRCGIFKKVLRKIPQCVSLMRDDVKIGHTFQKAFAFTLAETLIVMGIIGVVAALTIPNLNSSTADKEKVAKLNKIYSNLQDALGRAQAVYGPVDEWFQDVSSTNATKASDRFSERMMDFMKNTKDCGYNFTPCFAASYKNLDGTNSTFNSDGATRSYVMADGSTVGFYINTPACNTSVAVSNDSPESNICGFIYVDLDGAKGSATSGKDHFRFYVTKSGIVPLGSPTATTGKDDVALKAYCFKTGTTCAGWVIQTGNMDYLKLTDRTNAKCPNGTTLGWTNTTCK